MMKSEIYKSRTPEDIKDFINRRNLQKEDIISISATEDGYVLFYWK